MLHQIYFKFLGIKATNRGVVQDDLPKTEPEMQNTQENETKVSVVA
jgi:hypothetical protein